MSNQNTATTLKLAFLKFAELIQNTDSELKKENIKSVTAALLYSMAEDEIHAFFAGVLISKNLNIRYETSEVYNELRKEYYQHLPEKVKNEYPL